MLNWDRHTMQFGQGYTALDEYGKGIGQGCKIYPMRPEVDQSIAGRPVRAQHA